MFQKKTSGSVATISLIAVAASLFPYSPVQAQDGASTVQDLDQRIRILERKLELEKEAAETKAKDATTASASDKGFSLKKGDTEFKFNALVQLDGRWFIDDSRSTVAATNTIRNAETFTFRRIRPTFQGSIGKLVGYRLTPEFAGSSATIVDAYLDLKFDPAATVRVGKVKGPVGLERLQGGGSTAFIERGLPTELAPNRETGVQLQGALFEKSLNYTVGLYNGTRDGEDGGATDNNGLKEVAARVFYEPVTGIGFGVGGSHGSKEGPQEAPRSYSTPDRLGSGIAYVALAPAAGPFTSGVHYDGDATRISPQGYVYSGSFGLLGEYIISKYELRNIATGSTGKISNEAWQLVTGFVVTGEDASFSGVKPKTPYEIGKPGWGAVELVARYGELELDGDGRAVAQGGLGFFTPTSTSDIQNLAAGVNWYLNNNVKLSLNYNHTTFDRFDAAEREDDQSVFTRVQLQF